MKIVAAYGGASISHQVLFFVQFAICNQFFLCACFPFLSYAMDVLVLVLMFFVMFLAFNLN